MSLWRMSSLILTGILLISSVAFACGDDDDADDGDAGSPTEEASPLGENGDEGAQLELVAENVQFDTDMLTAAAGAEVSLTLDNRDTVPHSFELYESEGEEELFSGESFSGPGSLTYQFDSPAEPGTYYFQCGVHPAMNGDFVVE